MEPLQAGDPRRIGDYRLAARLGAGGMGLVYLGRSAAGRPVAVKVVHEHFAQDPGFRARFRREVDAARAVSGAFTAPVIDADPDAPTPWLVTAFLPGLSLQEAVAVHGPFHMPAMYALGAGLAEGLESVHQAGVVHRDLKPSNVLLSQDGPRIIDFGIARAAEAAAITRAGGVVGSPGYMSPEQAGGRQVGPASDVFSLGAVLTFAATGGAPFGTGSAQVMIYRVVHAQPALDAVTDPYLRALVADCLNKDPADRPTPAQVLGRLAPHAMAPQGTGWLPDQIAAAIGHVDTMPPTGTVVQPRSLSRRRLLIAAGAGGAVVAVGGIAAAVAAAGASSRNRPTAVPSVSARPASPSAAPPAGQVARRYTADAPVTFGPVLMNGSVYLTEGLSTKDLPDGRLVAIDLASGRRRWRFDDARGITKSNSLVRTAFPQVAAAGQVFVARYGVLYAVDAAGGRLLWSYRTGAAGPQTEPVVMDGTVYCLVRNPLVKTGYRSGLRLVALDAATGSVRWSGTTEPAKDDSHDRIELAAADGLISVIDGDLYAFGAADRRLRWRHRLNEAGTAAVAGDTVFAADQDGLRAVRVGKVRWTFTEADWIAGSPLVVHGGTVYLGTGVGSSGALYAIDAATGKGRWRFAADNTRPDGMAVSGGVVYAAHSTALYALDAATGQVRWRYRGEARIGSDLAAANGTVYVTGGTRTILALRTPGPAASPTN